MSERLRAFVRVRVRRGEAKYQRGVAAELAKYLDRTSSWVSEYTDPKPAQKRYADVEDTLKILAFFRARGDDPTPDVWPDAPVAPPPPLGVDPYLVERLHDQTLARQVRTFVDLPPEYRAWLMRDPRLRASERDRESTPAPLRTVAATTSKPRRGEPREHGKRG